ncbi:MAG: surface protein [Flavipsychrobacter sp.]|jgi:uncharacterized protein YjdB|nr:surface protein [Flavipsychrobacter sp.]
MKKNLILLLILSAAIPLCAKENSARNAQIPGHGNPLGNNSLHHNNYQLTEKLAPGSNLSFIENKGQITDQFGNARNDIQFKLAAANGLNIFIGNGAIHYQFGNCDNPEKSQIPNSSIILSLSKGQTPDNTPSAYTMYRMDVELVGANKNAKVITEQGQEYFERYFTAAFGEKGATAHAFKRIIYKDVYPKIDWVLYTAGDHLKHEFVVHEGGKVSDIKLKYGGATNLTLDKDGQLIAKTPQGTITEQTPYSYNTNKQEVKCSFKLQDSILSYTVADYTGTLVIDPTLAWATYFGGNNNDQSWGVATDGSGNVFITGFTYGSAGIATSGAYQTTLAGIQDAYIAKFNPAGSIQWATYYGGSGGERGYGIATDGSGNVYITGNTSSTSGVATPGAYQVIYGGGMNDAFIAKFDGTGTIQWATYYGGNFDDHGYKIASDGSGNVYITGWTGSTTGIATSGAYQTAYGGGVFEAFLAKFNSAGTIQWATYYGGAADDVGYGITTDGTGNVYFTGSTSTTSGITTSGAYQTTYGGGAHDAFLTKFSGSGTIQWATYFGGSNGDDGYGVTTDGAGNVYVDGVTQSTSAIATSGAYQTTLAGSLDIFLAKFSSSGAILWGTYYGGSDIENQPGIAFDGTGNIFITGLTLSTSGIASAGAHQPAFGGVIDGFLAEFNSSGAIQWATYYGGSAEDRGTGIAADGLANIYISGYTLSTSGIATSGTYQATFAGGIDAFLAKFLPISISGSNSVCAGSSITLTPTPAGGTWSSSNTTIATVGSSTGIVTGIASGVATISYTTGSGTVTKLITVNPLPSAITGTSTICSGSSTTLSTTTTGGTWSSSSTATATVNPSTGVVLSIGPASVTLDICYMLPTGCRQCLPMTVNALPTAFTVTGGGSYCAGDPGLHVGLGSSSTGINYELYRGGVATGIIVAGTGGAIDFGLHTIAGTYTVMATITATGCTRLMTGSVTITITPLPTLTCGPSAICVGGSVAPCTPSPAGGIWASSNTSVATIGSLSGLVNGVATGTATLTYTSTGGCYTTSGITVTTSPCPLSLTSVCIGGVTTFTNCISGGLWTSSNPSVANIGSLSGTVTGTGAGTAIISYSLGSSSCTVTGTMSVTSSVAPITGPTFACVGSTSSLSHTTPGGTWSSSNTAMATVGTTGIVTGIGTGIVTITYSVTGCTTTKTITVHATPATIIGPSHTCHPTCITEANSVGGGVWSGTSTIASVGSTSGMVCPTMTGVATITYSIGGCYVTKPITVYPTPTVITGSATVCVGATSALTNGLAGGTWSSSSIGIATIGSTGLVTGVSPGTTTISYTMSSGCASYLTITVTTAPAAISGTSNICPGLCSTYTNATGGGTWSTSPTAAGTIHATTGLYCGIAAGPATISYTIGGCSATFPVTVSTGPAPITGTTNVCVGSTTTLSDATPGGTWASSDISRATVGSATGIVTGVSTGTILISYTVGICPPAIAPVIINDVMPISGTPVVCVGQTMYLTNASLIGSWSSSDISKATINSSGLVTGMSAGTATITYMMPTGCFATMVVTVNPAPTSLTGPSTVCVGQTITLGPGTLSGGTWISSNTNASVSSTGVVTGVTVGYATISYVHTATGCFATRAITINGTPPAITGADDICVSTCATFTNPLAGGTWSTASSAATVGPSSGIVCAGASAGSAVISYTTPGTGCTVTKPVNIVLPPATITGAPGICAFSSTTLTSATTGGVWTSSNPVVASIGPGSGIVYGNTAGTATISYTLGCTTTRAVTINVAPPAITGATNICTGITTHLGNPLVGGRWYSSDTTIATVDSLTGIVTGRIPGAAVITYGLSNGCSNSVTVTVSPGIAPITGINRVCVGTSTLLSDASPGGVWSSSNPSVATITVSGLVTGTAIGTTTISYVVSGICPVTMVVTVNPNPGTITGATAVCAGSNITLSNPVSGGLWSSGSLSLATVNSTSGIVTGVAAGVADITYSMGVGCEAATYVTVNPLPLPISGPNSVCAAGTFTLTNATAGGTWSSSVSSIASVGSTGIVTGSSAGTALISYSISTGCAATHPVTIHPMPGPIAGASAVCLSGTITLSNAVTGGTWTSSTTGIMTVGSSSGVVSGIALGSATITYQLPAGCYVTTTLSVTPLPSGYTVTGGGNYCGGGTGVAIGLSSSSVGVNYMLRLGASSVGPFAGTGGAISFGLHTLTGTYTVTGTSTATGCTATMIGSAAVGITPFVVPAVSFTAVPSDTICSGATVVFTPIPVNGGSAPAYHWSVNGISVSAASTYSFIPANGDIVKVKMTSNAMCPLPDSAIYQDTMSVIPFGTPVVNLVPVPNDTVCQGTAVTVNAVTIFGGTAPDHRWMHNGTYVGGTSSYSFVPNDNDEVYCIMTSNYPCRYISIDTSQKVVFTVDTPKLPSVVIAATPGTTIELGQTDTLYVITDAVNPTYQWYINGIPVPGATTNTYISSSFSYPIPDSVSCLVTSNDVCVVSAHNWIYITVIQIDRTGVGSISMNTDIVILPNPNKGVFTIKGHIGSATEREVSVEIINMIGQTVYKNIASTTDGKIDEQVRLSEQLANGMYMLTLRCGSENRMFHLQVNR